MPGTIVGSKEDRATGISKVDSGRRIKRGYVIADDNLAGEKIYYDRGTVLRQLYAFGYSLPGKEDDASELTQGTFYRLLTRGVPPPPVARQDVQISSRGMRRTIDARLLEV